MFKLIGRGLIVSAVTLPFAASVLAAPLGLADSTSAESASSPIGDARVFCFNRASGRFLHWGSCNDGAPRVYCRNRWSGRFLHWGAC